MLILGHAMQQRVKETRENRGKRAGQSDQKDLRSKTNAIKITIVTTYFI